MIAETAGTRLKARREALGLTAETVCVALEISRATLWQWESGRQGVKIRRGMLREWERIISEAERRKAREGAA